MTAPSSVAPSARLMPPALRRILVALFVFGAVGVAAELVLLEHYDELWQWAPLVLLVASLPLAAWLATAGTAAAVRAFRAAMVVFLVSGVVGTILHYQGNVEFELERTPTLDGLALLWEASRGATPALAPGTMIQLGLIGLVATLWHPALARRDRTP